MARSQGRSRQTLVVSDDKNPQVAVKPGTKLEVVSVALVGPNLKKPAKLAARLCGGTTTCLALVEIPQLRKE